MSSDNSVVHVATSCRAALAEPTFLIEHEGRFYLTLAVLEYDPEAPDRSTRQDEDIKKLRLKLEPSNAGAASFADARSPSGKAIVVDPSAAVSFMNTKPPRPPGG